VTGKQLLGSGTPVGANYREGVRAWSKTEYASKLSLARMELEEALCWLELLEHAEIIPAARLAPLKAESSELSAIFVSLIKRARA
jgi:four helix bundle protein